MRTSRYLFLVLFTLLSGIYWFECDRDIEKYAFMLTSESCSCNTNDPVIHASRLAEREQESLILYAVFLIPAVVIGLLKPSKWANALVIICCCAGIAMLLLYGYAIATGRFGL